MTHQWTHPEPTGDTIGVPMSIRGALARMGASTTVSMPTRARSNLRSFKMSQLFPEQIAATQQANLDTLFGLANKIVDGFQQLVEPNLQVIKSTLAESQENAQQALAVKDLPELLALQTRVVQPIAEKLGAYGRHLYDIASATQAEFAKVTETQVAEQNRRVQTFVDTAAQNAPACSEAAVAAIKSAITSANTLYETTLKATQQAVEAAESNFSAAAAAASKAAQTVEPARAAKK
jgi:phasin family protein